MTPTLDTSSDRHLATCVVAIAWPQRNDRRDSTEVPIYHAPYPPASQDRAGGIQMALRTSMRAGMMRSRAKVSAMSCCCAMILSSKGRTA